MREAFLAAILLQVGAPSLLAGFLEGATLVVVSGLPGDIASEEAYEDQLGRLVQAVSVPPARPARIVALVDSPERASRLKTRGVQVEPASRERFRVLGRELAGAKGPLVVMVWGHAGLQGQRPVFHVRGPRLEPADLLAFADTAGERASSWVLYFRGSGAFARALAGRQRQILSSDQDVAFRSDPIGMPLLIDGLRQEPAVSFAELAVRVGRATAAWYDEQQLARTEEPTLWTATQARRLAGADAPAASTPAEPGSGSEAATPRETAFPQGTASPRAAASPLATASELDWEGIERVSAERFPGSKAVVLRRTHRFTIGDSPALAHETDEFIQILSPEGEPLADFDLPFWPPDERLSVLDCELLRPDGTLLRLGPDEMRGAEAPRAPEAEYPSASRRAFSLPGASPGAVLRLHVRREWRRFPLPQVILEVPLADPLPVMASSIEVRVGTGQALRHALSGEGSEQAGAPEVSETPHARRYLWRLGPTPALPDEALAPPNRLPRLLVSGFSDWRSFADWYGRLIKLADQITPEIEAKAAELVQGKASERDRVLALYDYVTGLRYVAVPLGVNSHRPHAAANVLRNRYGDCKDKANLFNTLLKTQGIPAQLVLVPRFGEAHEDAPGLGFNHAISRLRVDGEWVFADTTDPFARFGLLPPGDPGRWVLVIDGESRSLARLAEPSPQDHRLELKGLVAGDGRGSLELTAHGFADYALRSAWRQTADQGATRPLLRELLQPSAGEFALERQSATPVSSLERAFEWRAEGSFAALTSRWGERGRLLRAPFWLPAEWAGALHARQTPLFLNQGYPLVLDQTLRLELPEGARGIESPAPVAQAGRPLSYRVEWSRGDDGRLVARLQLELAKGDLGREETASFQQQLRALLGALAQGALYDVPASR